MTGEPSMRVARAITQPESRALVVAAVKQGSTVTMTGGGHVRIATPTGGLVFTGLSPSDARSWRALRQQLRRAGVDIP